MHNLYHQENIPYISPWQGEVVPGVPSSYLGFYGYSTMATTLVVKMAYHSRRDPPILDGHRRRWRHGVFHVLLQEPSDALVTLLQNKQKTTFQCMSAIDTGGDAQCLSPPPNFSQQNCIVFKHNVQLSWVITSRASRNTSQKKSNLSRTPFFVSDITTDVHCLSLWKFILWERRISNVVWYFKV